MSHSKIDTHILMPNIYVAGRYSDGGILSPDEELKNRIILRYFSLRFMKQGWSVICPIENNEWAFQDGILNYDDCLSSDLSLIRVCDAIFFCPGWEEGRGTLVEHDFATQRNIPILYEVMSADDFMVKFGVCPNS